jgi:hypothetical protein
MFVGPEEGVIGMDRSAIPCGCGLLALVLAYSAHSRMTSLEAMRIKLLDSDKKIQHREMPSDTVGA